MFSLCLATKHSFKEKYFYFEKLHKQEAGPQTRNRAYLCLCFQGDTLVFPVTKAVRGAPGPRGPDGKQVTHLLFITTAGNSVFKLFLVFWWLDVVYVTEVLSRLDLDPM